MNYVMKFFEHVNDKLYREISKEEYLEYRLRAVTNKKLIIPFVNTIKSASIKIGFKLENIDNGFLCIFKKPYIQNIIRLGLVVIEDEYLLSFIRSNDYKQTFKYYLIDNRDGLHQFMKNIEKS